jgi:hypothetical protein
MFPTSNLRTYANLNQKLTKERAETISKTMSKFYKKPKADVIPTPRPIMESSNFEYTDEPTSIPLSPKKEIKKKNIKNVKKNDKKKHEEVKENENIEELNYIGNKDDLENLEFLFREATGYEIDKDTSTDDDVHEDEYELAETEKREKREKNHKIIYPFSQKSSSHFSQDYTENDDSSDILVEFLIYRVNNNAYKPFLEFMLYKADNTFYLPNVMCNSITDNKRGSDIDSDIGSDIEPENPNIYDKVISTLDTIFVNTTYKIKGRLIPSKHMNIIDENYLDERYILFIECILDDTPENIEGNVSAHYIPEETKLWWVTISEIFNYKKVLFFPVHDSVVNLFYSYPEIMNIFMKGKLIEIPIVVYNGNNDKYTKYNAIFSLKKAPQFSRYGPFYYFTDLHSSFKYACYDIEDNMRKFERGGLLRTILFPQKIKVFLERDKIDESMMAQYLFDKYPEKINTGQFRDNDNKWVKKYNTAYNGEYMIIYDRDKYVEEHDIDDEYVEDDKGERGERDETKENIEKIPFPVMFCVSEYNQQQVISYHYVDTDDIPDKYSYEFKDYKLL